MFNRLKKMLIAIVFMALFFGANAVYAATPHDPPTMEEAQGVIERIFNIVVLSAVGVFVAVAAYGIWKSSLSVGDPRGLDGAKQTWTYALYGFAVVVLFWAIFKIAQEFLGIPAITPKDLLDRVFEALQSLVTVSITSGRVY